MKCYSRLVLLISLFIIFEKTESVIELEYISGCYANDNYHPKKLIDQDINQRWMSNTCIFGNLENIYYVYFKTKTISQVTGYKITLSERAVAYAGSNPKSWVLKAKQSETDEFKDIHNSVVPKDSCKTNYHNYSYLFESPVTYQFFALVVLSVQDVGGPVSIAELWLFASCTNEIEAYGGCTCDKEVCEYGQLCKNGKCLSSCPNDKTAPDIGCMCGSVQNICSSGTFCNSKNKCLSSCPKDDIAPDIGCICGSVTNICNEGQTCISNNICLPPCPKDDIAPETGCICGENGNVCNEGQICNVVDCWYPRLTSVSGLFLNIGLFFASTLMFSFVLFLIIG